MRFIDIYAVKGGQRGDVVAMGKCPGGNVWAEMYGEMSGVCPGKMA